jgi:hypothetical protein
MVTVVGVAYRGQIPLEDIMVDFEVEPVELPNAIGFGVREVVTLKGQLSQSQRLRLQRAAQYCPWARRSPRVPWRSRTKCNGAQAR